MKCPICGKLMSKLKTLGYFCLYCGGLKSGYDEEEKENKEGELNNV